MDQERSSAWTDRTLEVLEWPELQRVLEERAQTAVGRTLLSGWGPGRLSADQARSQALAILELGELRSTHGHRLPLADFPEVRSLLVRISRSGAITVEELANLLRFQRGIQGMSQFLAKHTLKSPNLARQLQGLQTLDAWSRKHFALVDLQGQLVDDASEDLKALRAYSRDLSSRIQNRLEDFLHNPREREVLQDSYITLRDGRYVLPIKTNFKGRVGGIIHGVSNSEQTLFIEPQEIVEWNNQLKMVEKEIELEI
ncbi:hypothetical protein EB061_12830, partial [bacterium]|nr:hypothetical protein [bacterium]